MKPLKLIGRPGPGLDTLLGPPVSWRCMSRGIALLWLAGAAFGCSSAPPAAPPNQMAATARVETPVQAPPVPAPVATNTSGEIAARINNDIITWKDVQEVLKEIKPGDLSMELKKSKLRDMAEERMFLQAAKKYNLIVTEQELDEAQRRDIKMYG